MPPRAVWHPARLELRVPGQDCLKAVGAMQNAVVPVPVDFELPHLITVVVSSLLWPARSLGCSIVVHGSGCRENLSGLLWPRNVLAF